MHRAAESSACDGNRLAQLGDDMAKILVVEDEEAVMELLRTVLSGGGHEVFAATNGEEALQTRDLGGLDMLITDVNMPGMDGRALAASIQENSPDLPTIFVSGDPSLDATGVAGMPNSLYIRKPFKLAEVRDAVARMLR